MAPARGFALPAPARRSRSARATLAPAPAADGAPEVEAAAGPGAREARIATLEWRDFAADVDACTACGLARTRNRSVPGVGDVDADWLFVGEAPGSEEDARGEPFVGQAGRLLDNMLAALGMKRGENVYIANVLKCRPPNNRTPEPREIEACRALPRPPDRADPAEADRRAGQERGDDAARDDATIASLRGRVHRYRGVPLVVTYHPAYLLRNLPDKAKAWEDLLFARRTLAGAVVADPAAEEH